MPKTNWKPLAIILSLSFTFFMLFVIGAFTFFSKGMDGGSNASGKGMFKNQAVGVIELNGVIMDSKKFLKTLAKYETENQIKAVVVRINSPGGAVAPSQEIYKALKKFPKPVVASMSSVAASGGYYVAVAAKRIFANAGTITGSIGVIMEFANLEKLYEWAKIKRYSIKTGKFKDAGADYRDMTTEERAQLQTMVDDVLMQFKTAVAEGRGLKMEELTPLADGRIFSGQQAQVVKLVDEIGTLDDAITEAAKLAGITGKPKVYRDDKKKGWMEILQEQMGEQDDEDASSKSVFSLFGVKTPTLTLAPGVYWIWKGAL
jgi:protease-4